MNRQQIQREIEVRLADGGSDHQRVTMVLARGEVNFQIDEAGPMAVSLHSIEYSSPPMGDLTGSQLTRFSEMLAARLTYLLEPISTIEADPDVVQLRSDPPSMEDESTRCYFELLARSNGLRLVRYRKTKCEPRACIPMQLTYEVVARLLVDLDSAARSL